MELKLQAASLGMSLLQHLGIPRTLESRKMFDPYMICSGPVPSRTVIWPDGFNAMDFPEVMDLCSAANGKAHNIGCICVVSNGRLDCDLDTADRQLASAPFGGDRTLKDFCQRQCRCATATEAQRETRPRPTAWWQMIGINVMENPDSDGLSKGSDSSGNPQPPHLPTQSEPVPNQCGTTKCTSNQDCSSTSSNSSCTCTTTSSTYQPGPGTVAFMAACMVSLGGKRDDIAPCPCNSTYVSFACCDAADGIVREDAKHKLGELEI